MYNGSNFYINPNKKFLIMFATFKKFIVLRKKKQWFMKIKLISKILILEFNNVNLPIN